jgi:hypothetical protein
LQYLVATNCKLLFHSSGNGTETALTMMITIPPKYVVSQVLGFIKGKSAIHLARVDAERKRDVRGRIFVRASISSRP